jgi:putative ABC transport system permease protein
MYAIAIRNLIHDKTRFVIALTGVTFSVILISAQAGIYLGFRENAATIIEHVEADIWVTSRNSRNFDFSQPIPERRVNQVLRVQGVASAEKLILGWGIIKNPDGGSEQVEVIGYDPDVPIGVPWSMREGRIEDVKGGMKAILDESAQARLGAFTVGDYREIMGQRLKIVGLSREAKSLTTAPFVFTSYETAQRVLSYIGAENTVFILVRVVPGADPREVAEDIRYTVDHVDVYTKADYAWKTKQYWTFETGVGFGFLLTMVMAFVVGIVIVGQTIYSSTVDHLKEFGTLKAIGATNRHIYQIIFNQAFINAILGYIVGAALTLLARGFFARAGIELTLPPETMVGILGLTLLMCFLAGFFSVWKALQVEPAAVFR